ncbi:hypothetical protein M231_02644 [Tremella mesenterica]|uniref:Cytochrome c oxidase subunit 8, mitochondrial n=1 Tax=Tremella mesenterica TaxID=5217 RepID=A0A4Q1BQ01_TREME|nr:hypothetical protein M231_02644 [Tremella mesenterica]
MSLVARNLGLRASRSIQMVQLRPVQARFAHIENTVGHALPTSVENKTWLGVKMVLFGTVGFALPFIIAGYQLNKSAGSS